MNFQGKNKVFVDNIKITKAWFDTNGCSYDFNVSMYREVSALEYTHVGDIYIVAEISWGGVTVNVTDVYDECPPTLLKYLRKELKKVILSIQRNLEDFLRRKGINPIQVAKNNMDYVPFSVKAFMPNVYTKENDKFIIVNDSWINA